MPAKKRKASVKKTSIPITKPFALAARGRIHGSDGRVNGPGNEVQGAYAKWNEEANGLEIHVQDPRVKDSDLRYWLQKDEFEEFVNEYRAGRDISSFRVTAVGQLFTEEGVPVFECKDSADANLKLKGARLEWESEGVVRIRVDEIKLLSFWLEIDVPMYLFSSLGK